MKIKKNFFKPIKRPSHIAQKAPPLLTIIRLLTLKKKFTFHHGHTKEQITHPEFLRIGYNDKNNAENRRKE